MKPPKLASGWLAAKLLSRPPHRKRSECGRASGSEGVWQDDGLLLARAPRNAPALSLPGELHLGETAAGAAGLEDGEQGNGTSDIVDIAQIPT